MGIPLRAGRAFNDADDAAGAKVVIVNEAFAQRYVRGYASGSSSLGGRLVFGRDNTVQIEARTGKPAWRQVIGIVGNVRSAGLHTEPRPEMYLPYAQEAWPQVALVLRTAGDADSVALAIRHQVASIHRSAAVTGVQRLDDLIGNSMAGRRFQTVLLACFAGAAVLLAALGIHATMAYAVARRTQEIGIRMALGAQRASVLGQLARESGALTAAGIAMGLAIALALQTLIGALLFGVAPTDPITLTVAAGLLAAVATLSSMVPAFRATQIDPLAALRSD
jgi:putative ABC transport system permease protein